jgi:3',5'-cyclic AMP phosphodiesterase CpdA
MKIGLLSDIHSHRYDHADDIDDLIRFINEGPVPDLVVFAGDISHRTDEILGFLSRIDLPCEKCWVPGNHDIWVIDSESDDDSSEERYSRSFKALSEKAGWHYLPDRPFLLSGDKIALVGTIGWFTDKGYSEWHDLDSSGKDLELALRFKGEVEAQIDALEDDWRVILVSHHLVHQDTPSFASKKGALWNSHMQELVAGYGSRILAVLHGHVHERYDPVCIEGVLFCAHPFGYPGDHNRIEDGYRMFEISI